jgi:uncharacterized protein (UPF0147 family)
MSKNKLANSKKSATKQLERSKRQAILMRVIERNKPDDPTFEELAAMMRDDPWVAARWPSYSAQTANKDFAAVMSIVRDDVKDLAVPYLVRQVNLIDEAINTLSEFSKDDQLPHKMRIDSLNAMRGYLDQMGKVFGNFAPREMHIKKAELVVNLDNFKQLKERAKKQLDVIEGEVIEG